MSSRPRRHRARRGAAKCSAIAALAVVAALALAGPAHAVQGSGTASSPTIGYTGGQGVTPDASTMAQHAQHRTQVDVTAFGADPTGKKDSAQAIADAIQYAKGLKTPTTIVFPCGHYQIYPEHTPVRELYVSNTTGADQTYKDKHIGILIQGMSDVIVDGDGSQLTFHGDQTQFAAIDSTNVSFENFDTDWFAPEVVDTTVLDSGVADGHGYRDIEVADGTGYTINGATATFTGEKSPTTGQPYWTLTPDVTTGWENQTRDLATGLTVRGAVPLWDGSTSVSELRPHVLRVSYATAADPGGANEVYEMRRTDRTTPAAFIWQSTNTDLDNLELHYLHGFGIVGQLSTNVTLDRVQFKAEPGTWQQTASFADFVQMSSVSGSVQITNSLFDNPQDDPINVHGTYLQVTAIDRANRTVTLQYMHPQTAGFPQFYPGNQLRFVNKSTLLPDGSGGYTVASVDGPTGTDTSHSLTTMTVKLDHDLPADLAANQFVAENLTYTPQVYIAGNTFQSVPTRGILVTSPRKTVIERNRFDQMAMASIYISDDANNWYESGPVTDVTIRDNIFDRPTTAYPVIYVDPIISATVPGQTVHRNIAIEGNDFQVLPGTQLVGATSVTNLSFTDNTVRHYAPTDPVDPATVSTAPLFSFVSSQNVTLSGNTYAPGFNLRANTSAMDASQVVASDGVRVNQDNVTSLGTAAPQLVPGFSWVREDPTRWSAVNDSTVILKTGVNGLWMNQNAAVNVLLKPQPVPADDSITINLSGVTKSDYEEAGLIFYTDDDNYVELERKHNNGSPTLSLVTETAGNASENNRVPVPAGNEVVLKLTRNGTTFTASYSTDGTTFTPIGSISNGAVGPDARIGVLAAGQSAYNTPFTFSDFTVNGTAQPFFASVPTPVAPKLAAALGTVDWNGVDFGNPASPLAWVAHTPAGTTSLSAAFPPAAAGTRVNVLFNAQPIQAGSDGRYTFPLASGPNTVQVETADSNGNRQTYRWVIVSDQPQAVPGSTEKCDPQTTPAPTPTPGEPGTPTTPPAASGLPGGPGSATGTAPGHSAHGSALASTGSDVAGGILAGVLLALLGTGLVLIRARRRPTR